MLRILVSSPEDIKEARKLVGVTAEELNRTALEDTDLRLEVLSWETHSAPDFGSDPQDVINRQIRDWDIYVGLLGTRFGTPTPRAGSGTEEEFNDAYHRWEQDPRSCRLMLYFSNASVTPSMIDPLQLVRVQAFKERLGTLGGLYWTFEDINELPRLLRQHLLIAIKEYGRKWGPATQPVGISTSTDLDRQTNMEDGPGLLDLLADAQEAMDSISGSMARITAAQTESSEILSQTARELEALTSAPPVNPRAARILVQRASAALSASADCLDREVPLMRSGWRGLKEATILYLSVQDFSGPGKKEELKGLVTALAELKTNVSAATKAMGDQQDALSAVPDLSRDMRRATRHARSSSAAFATELRSIEISVAELEVAARNRLNLGN